MNNFKNISNDIWTYDLYIFDLDDTLVKSEFFHYQAWMITLQNELNDNFFSISFELFCENFHSKDPNSIKNYVINLLNITQEDFLNVSKEKNETYIKLLNNSYKTIEMIDGAEDFLNKILSKEKQFIIVSNSPLNNINFYLERFPILKNAAKLYYRELFTNKKPNPECYQMVLKDFPHLIKKIGFEDSITGIMALLQVSEILPVFINDEFYTHYKTIKTENPNLLTIKNYFDLI